MTTTQADQLAVQLLDETKRIARHIARQRRADPDDVESEAYVALVKATRAWCATRSHNDPGARAYVRTAVEKEARRAAAEHILGRHAGIEVPNHVVRTAKGIKAAAIDLREAIGTTPGARLLEMETGIPTMEIAAILEATDRIVSDLDEHLLGTR